MERAIVSRDASRAEDRQRSIRSASFRRCSGRQHAGGVGERLRRRGGSPGPRAPSARRAAFRSRRGRSWSASAARGRAGASSSPFRATAGGRAPPSGRCRAAGPAAPAVASTSTARWRTIRSARSSIAAGSNVWPQNGRRCHGGPKPWLNALFANAPAQAGRAGDGDDEQARGRMRARRCGRHISTVGLGVSGWGLSWAVPSIAWPGGTARPRHHDRALFPGLLRHCKVL